MTTESKTQAVRRVGQQRLEPIVGGKYLLEGEVGRGSFAIVYKARHTAVSSLYYAVKVLKRNASDDPSIVARFQREAEAMASLRSPHVVQVVDFGQTEGGLPYLVMPLLHGQTVAALIERDGMLRPSDVARFSLDVLSAAEEAHTKGMVHRDLKPANIFVTKTPGKAHPQALVLDFGIVKVIDGGSSVLETADHVFLGTPAYAAPELLRGQPGPRCDLYALGHVMIAMMEGQAPYGEEPTHAMAITRHLSEKPVPLKPSTLASALGDIIVRACEKDGASRFQTAAEMAEAIRATGLHEQAVKPLHVDATIPQDPQAPSGFSHNSVNLALLGDVNTSDYQLVTDSLLQWTSSEAADSTVDMLPSTHQSKETAQEESEESDQTAAKDRRPVWRRWALAIAFVVAVAALSGALAVYGPDSEGTPLGVSNLTEGPPNLTAAVEIGEGSPTHLASASEGTGGTLDDGSAEEPAAVESRVEPELARIETIAGTEGAEFDSELATDQVRSFIERAARVGPSNVVDLAASDDGVEAWLGETLLGSLPLRGGFVPGTRPIEITFRGERLDELVMTFDAAGPIVARIEVPRRRRPDHDDDDDHTDRAPDTQAETVQDDDDGNDGDGSDDGTPAELEPGRNDLRNPFRRNNGQ